MAIYQKCKSCKAQLSASADVCPFCKAELKKGSMFFKNLASSSEKSATRSGKVASEPKPQPKPKQYTLRDMRTVPGLYGKKKQPSGRWWMGLGLFALFVFGVTGYGKSKSDYDFVRFERAAYGGMWDLKIDAVEVTCRKYRGRPNVVIRVGGTEYALNGAALGSGLYPDGRIFMERDKLGARSIDMARHLIGEGLRMCDMR